MTSFAQEDECPTMLKEPDEVKTLGELRVKAIKGWDKLFTWALSFKKTQYPFLEPSLQKTFHVTSKALSDFALNYGYFSIFHPIVGIDTDSERDIQVTQCLLHAIQQEIKSSEQLRFTTDEILAKVMAYRSLQKGEKIILPYNQIYTVDKVIDLWRGMPAFCLIPENKQMGPPIILFRGTSLNLTSEGGWASILSDLDTTGPGYSTFLRAQGQIHSWLKKMNRLYSPPRAIGFSLGGVFVLYCLIYESNLLNKEIPSVAFNPPGVSEEVFEKWVALPKNQRAKHITYINQGDFVSQIGLFLSNVWEISLDKSMGIIEAHVSFISAKPFYKMNAIDVQKVNKAREPK